MKAHFPLWCFHPLKQRPIQLFSSVLLKDHTLCTVIPIYCLWQLVCKFSPGSEAVALWTWMLECISNIEVIQAVGLELTSCTADGMHTEQNLLVAMYVSLLHPAETFRLPLHRGSHTLCLAQGAFLQVQIMWRRLKTERLCISRHVNLIRSAISWSLLA